MVHTITFATDSTTLGRLSAYDSLADGVVLAFDRQSNMKCMARISNDVLGDHLVINGSGRGSHDWMALEIELQPKCHHVIVEMKYAPTERIFPRIYFEMNRRSQQFDMADVSASDHFSNYHIDIERAFGQNEQEIGHARNVKLALLFPNREWFALGLRSITQETL